MGNTLELPSEIYQVIGSELAYSTKIVLGSVCKSLRERQNTIEFQSIRCTYSHHTESQLSQMYDYANIRMYIHYPPLVNAHVIADCAEHKYKVVLYDAIKRGDEQVAIWASEYIRNLDSVWNEYVPCLAVLSGKIESLEWVTKLFSAINRTCYTMTALQCAVAECNYEMLESLLNKCTIPPSHPSTLYLIAAETGSVELLNWLKKRIPTYNPANFDIDFSITIKLGHWDAFQWFMDNTQVWLHVTRLFDASLQYNRVQVAKLFIHHHHVVSCYNENMTEIAAVNGYLELLQLLFSVNCPYDEHLACFVPEHHEEVIKYLSDAQGVHVCDDNIECRPHDNRRNKIAITVIPSRELANMLFVKNPSEIKHVIKSTRINGKTVEHLKSHVCLCVHPRIRKKVAQHTRLISQVEANGDSDADISIGWLLFILTMIIYMVMKWSLYLFF